MRSWVTLSLMVLLAACSGATGPKGLDPTVSYKNAGPYSLLSNAEITFVWFDQGGQVQTTVIPWGDSVCIHFTATQPADSVRYVYFGGDTTGASGQWARGKSPWFDPATGITRDTVDYPYGAEYWWYDGTRNPSSGTLPTPPC